VLSSVGCKNWSDGGLDGTTCGCLDGTTDGCLDSLAVGEELGEAGCVVAFVVQFAPLVQESLAFCGY